MLLMRNNKIIINTMAKSVKAFLLPCLATPLLFKALKNMENYAVLFPLPLGEG
jgi:hypothetical protein